LAVSCKKIYSKSNLGLRERIFTGINEFFACEENGIFLEEDRYPDPTFFEFAQENLAHWKNHPQVAVISGSSFAKEKENKLGYSYYFSKYPHCWGWATWKRAWQYYDPSEMLLAANLEILPVSMDGKTELRYWESRPQGGGRTRRLLPCPSAGSFAGRIGIGKLPYRFVRRVPGSLGGFGFNSLGQPLDAGRLPGKSRGG